LQDFGPYSASDQNWMSDDADMLWKNDELADYLHEAQTEYTRLFPIKDKTTAAVCNLSLVASTSDYAIHDSIFEIDRVTLSGVEGTLDRYYSWELDEVREQTWEGETGEPTGYLLDLDNRQIRFYPTPTATYTATLWVRRKPLLALEWTRNHRNLEIPEDDQLFLLHYAAHLAYLKDDTEETQDLGKSEHFRQLFYEHLGADVTVQQARIRAATQGRPRVSRTYY
jgi:hypothetical protein